MTTTHGERVDMRRDAPDLYRAQAALDRAVRESALDTGLVAGDDGRLDRAYDEAAAHFDADELAALLYGIASINTWNRVAVATHAVFEP